MATNYHHYLRMYRKQSRLTQSDLAFLFGFREYSSICHWEKGKRIPTLEIIIFYHLLFDVPADSLFDNQKKVIANRIGTLIAKLKPQEANPQLQSRIRFLDSSLKRLIA